MITHFRNALCTILTIASLHAVSGNEIQEGNRRISFSNISIDNGLSQNTVFSICQDKDGFIWIATFEGLNRFDGNSFTAYLHDDNDPSSILDNIVHNLFLDSSGTLWAGTRSGISRWNGRKEVFENFPTQSPVTAIEEISGGQLMVGTEEHLHILDTGSGQFTDSFPDEIARLRTSALYRTGSTIYIGTKDEGLFTYSLNDGDFRRVPLYSGNKPIQVMLSCGQDILWMGTEGDGLYRLCLADGSAENFRNTGKPGSIGSNYIRSLGTDTEGRLWVGTFNSLNIFDTATETFRIYTNDPFDSHSLSHNSVRSIMRDSQGGMWLGTYFGGLDYWHPLRERFISIKQIPGRNSLNDNVINCITEDSGGTVWIGTNNGCVNHFVPRTGTFTYYGPDPENIREGIESNDVKAIHIDKYTGNIYVGAQAGGLNILRKGSKNMEQCRADGSITPPRDIYAIAEATPDALWIGSLQGLYSYDKATESFTSRDSRLRIRSILHDSQGRLWTGGENGLEVMLAQGLSLKPAEIRNEEVRSLAFIYDFLESSSGLIWIATRKGLYSYNDKEGSLRRYTSASGLPSDVIHGIEEDSYGRLWISTDNGLSCMNPYSGKFRNFTVEDGLQSKQFNPGSHCRRQSGEMLFGGIKGIVAFIPERLTDNPYTPAPILTGMSVFNSPVKPGDESGILSGSLATTEGIVLRHDQNSFTVNFTVTDFIAGGHNIFAYMLKGFDKDWIYTSSARSATYSNLPHGRYSFMVKAANNDGKWNNEPTVLDIRVKPVWYQTILAKILMFLMAVLLVAGGIKFYLERKKIETNLELEKKDREHQEEINQMKIRFFINISHELRTPLTLILNPLQEMIGKASDIWMRKQLKYVFRNAQRLLHLVNQLMDYRRAELGVFKLRVKQEDINRLIKENFSYYEKLALSKKLKYTFQSGLAEGEMLYVDGQYLELILNNLLSNAFKYTDEGSITVRAFHSGDGVAIEVSDTGTGIPANQQDRIFERFYQVENAHIGSGIGLSLVYRLVELHHAKLELDSEEGKGSTFRVIFPQDPAAYSEEELGKEENAAETHTTNAKEMYMLDTEKQEEEELIGGGDARRGRILIVEDNDEIRTYMNNGLSSMFDIVLASNGQEALEKMKGKEIDLIITDLMMPVMDGIQLCAHIKQNIETNHIPIIMLSAKTDSKDQLHALQTGADDFISKPFSMTVLTAKIRNMMRRQMRIMDKATKSMEITPEKMGLNAMDEQILKKAVSIVEQNMDNAEFTTEEFAAAMNMSRSNLHLKLKALTGESALDFIHKIRFKEACRLLQDGRYSVSEISDMVGFNTPSYFATCFKKHIGCLPTEWGRKNKI